MSVKRERNYGIDLLRIVSMLMVVILHVLGQGGVLKSSEPLSVGYSVAWLLDNSFIKSILSFFLWCCHLFADVTAGQTPPLLHIK